MGPMVAPQVRREQDKNGKWLRTLRAARPPFYRTRARGGLTTAPPTTATITAITTISYHVPSSSPRMPSSDGLPDILIPCRWALLSAQQACDHADVRCTDSAEIACL